MAVVILTVAMVAIKLYFHAIHHQLINVIAKDVMINHTSTKDDHTTSLRLQCTIVKKLNILDDINDEPCLSPSIEVDHIAECTICERRTVDWDFIFPAPVVDAVFIIDLLTNPSNDL